MFQDWNINIPLCECTELHVECSLCFVGGLLLGDMGVRSCLMVTAVIPEQVSWNVGVLPVSFSNGEFGFLCQKQEEFSIRVMNENMTITSNLVQGLQMSRAIPLLHIFAFMIYL